MGAVLVPLAPKVDPYRVHSWLDPGPVGPVDDDRSDERCIPRTELIRFEASTEHVFEARRWRSFTREQAPVAVLLVAYGPDRDLLQPTLNLLANQGSVIYVDFREEGFSDPPAPEALTWMQKCLSLDGRLVQVATMGGLRSPWTAKQLDLAEGVLGLRNVAILPVEDFGFVRPHALLHRYPTIRRGASEWRVVGPHGRVGPSLRSWLAP